MTKLTFAFETFNGIYLHWTNQEDTASPEYYHEYPIEGFIFYHVEDGVVVEDFVKNLNPYNYRDYKDVFNFPDTITKIPVHRNLQVKSIAKEWIFIANREDKSWDGEKQYVFIHKDCVGLGEKSIVKVQIRKPPFTIYNINFELVEEFPSNFGTFQNRIKTNLEDYQEIKSLYDNTIKEWKQDGPRGLTVLRHQVKLLEAEIKDLEYCLGKWKVASAEELLQDPKISIRNKTTQEFLEGGDK